MLSKKELFESIKMSGIGKYYDKMSGRFFIPDNDLDMSISEAVIECLKNGFALSLYKPDYEEDDLVYTLFDISLDTRDCREVKACRDSLYDMLHNECGVHYFTEMSFMEYSTSMRYQKAIDYVLENSDNYSGSNNEWVIVLVADSKGFKFVEVLEPFV